MRGVVTGPQHQQHLPLAFVPTQQTHHTGLPGITDALLTSLGRPGTPMIGTAILAMDEKSAPQTVPRFVLDILSTMHAKETHGLFL